MEEVLDDIKPTGKVFIDRAFWAGTFFGGPLVAGYFFSENFKTLGQFDKVKPTWIITIVTTFLIFGIAFLIPDNVKFPNQLIPIIYTIATVYLFKKHQDTNVDKHIKEGGSTYKWTKVILVAVIGVAITIIPFLIYAFSSGVEMGQTYDTKSYGYIVKHEITFDRNNISEAEIDQIADGLGTTGFFDATQAKFVHVEKNNYQYVIFISVIEGTENDKEASFYFEELQVQMNRLFRDYEVQINLVVDYIDNVVKEIK